MDRLPSELRIKIFRNIAESPDSDCLASLLRLSATSRSLRASYDADKRYLDRVAVQSSVDGLSRVSRFLAYLRRRPRPESKIRFKGQWKPHFDIPFQNVDDDHTLTREGYQIHKAIMYLARYMTDKHGVKGPVHMFVYYSEPVIEDLDTNSESDSGTMDDPASESYRLTKGEGEYETLVMLANVLYATFILHSAYFKTTGLGNRNDLLNNLLIEAFSDRVLQNNGYPKGPGTRLDASRVMRYEYDYNTYQYIINCFLGIVRDKVENAVDNLVNSRSADEPWLRKFKLNYQEGTAPSFVAKGNLLQALDIFEVASLFTPIQNQQQDELAYYILQHYENSGVELILTMPKRFIMEAETWRGRGAKSINLDRFSYTIFYTYGSAYQTSEDSETEEDT